MRFLILALLLVGCAKGSGSSAAATDLDHAIVGSWSRNAGSLTLTFSASRTLEMVAVQASHSCTITTRYTYDIADADTLSLVYLGLEKSDDANCEQWCQDTVGAACTTAVGLVYGLPALSSADFAISGTVLTLDGSQYDRN